LTDERLRELRALVRAGETPDDLVEELRQVARRLVRLRLLPPVFAPYGIWNAEAAEEIFADWYAERLLARGHLKLLVDRARNGRGFRKLAELSLRQHLYNQSARSQARNLFGRLVEILEEGEGEFVLLRDAARPQDRYWRLASNPGATEWAGDDATLVSYGWAIGDLEVIRYKADAKKLSPVLSTDDLKQFIAGLLERAGAALSPRLLMQALEARFDLGEVSEEELPSEGPGEPARESDIAGDLALNETAVAIVDGLTPRQLEVLRRTDSDQTIDEMASALRCSVGTVVNEQKRIGHLISRFSETEEERISLLRIVRDRVYGSDETE
jgi:hypothetical protein